MPRTAGGRNLIRKLSDLPTFFPAPGKNISHHNAPNQSLIFAAARRKFLLKANDKQDLLANLS